MDWFERLFGFREVGYDKTRRQLGLDGRQLRSRVNGRTYGIGELELVSLGSLRERVRIAGMPAGRLSVRIVTGDVRAMHALPEYAGALFQVASQFNLLEMTAPEVSPEHGVTRYRCDGTQGPACAMAAGAATVYRNYFAPVAGGSGQTSERQLDGLADLGAAFGASLGVPVNTLWTMRNGYALCTQAGLEAISGHLASLGPAQIDALRGLLRIGCHRDVEVTDALAAPPPIVSQAFCSALPVAYSRVPPAFWAPFATLILEAAYEATLLAAMASAQCGGSNVVLLTRLGGGAFGNDAGWIDAAMTRALRLAAAFDLDVRLVSYGLPTPALQALAADFSQ
ncbi:hypothetical protein [uncultured Thiodictyon sp.]|uniref:hypothetical protein n=1 Tax=uncultured Thiodictyon sp. TaxID=1846217 RepID=UPI0025E5C075|nr:hypothetical protein [uncultured Thiodictyon sp.]